MYPDWLALIWWTLRMFLWSWSWVYDVAARGVI